LVGCVSTGAPHAHEYLTPSATGGVPVRARGQDGPVASIKFPLGAATLEVDGWAGVWRKTIILSLAQPGMEAVRFRDATLVFEQNGARRPATATPWHFQFTTKPTDPNSKILSYMKSESVAFTSPLALRAGDSDGRFTSPNRIPDWVNPREPFSLVLPPIDGAASITIRFERKTTMLSDSGW
jgi:hypothetical protein